MSANFAQLQRDALAKLLSEPLLADLNIKSLRDLQSLRLGEGEDPQQLMEAYMVWTTPRAGGTKIGCGALVNMPTKENPAPNAPGPERSCVLTITTFEDPVLNLAASATSTGKTAEEWSDLIEAILHQWGVEQLGSLWVKKTAPNRDVQGVVAYDSEFHCTISRADIEQVVVPTLAEAALTITLTNVTSGASIYYTTDGTFPGQDAATGLAAGTATLYTVPFTVASGATVRWAAYKTDLRGSDVGHALIT